MLDLNYSRLLSNDCGRYARQTHRFIFKPEEVAEVEISVAQCDGGVALLEIAPRCAHQVPHLQYGLVGRRSFWTKTNEDTDEESI